MKRGMRGTLSGWCNGRQVSVEVSSDVLDRFNAIKRKLGLREADLMGLIAQYVPHGHRLDEKHVIWYLDMLEQLEKARRGRAGAGNR